MSTTGRPTVAMLLWGDLFEDFHATIGVSIEDFRTTFTGGWLFGYVEALDRAGADVLLVQVSERVRAPARFIHEPTGAAVVLLPQPRRHRLARSLRPHLPRQKASSAIASWLSVPPLALRRELRRVGATALLVQEYEHARFDLLVLLGRALRLPVLATFQGGDRTASRLESLVRPRTVRAASGLIIASQRERDRVRRRYGVPPDRIADIPNGLDVTAHQTADRAGARHGLGIPATTTVVQWQGRVVLQRKGLDLLCDAWDQVVRERPDQDVLLLLVGTGPDADRLHALVDDLPAGTVRWQDAYVTDRAALRAYAAAADVFVLPSRHEGFPVSPLEAMAAGLPVVAADAPGVRDILAEGEAHGGIIVPVGDPSALAAAIGRLVDDPDHRRRLAQAAVRRSQAFDLDAIGVRLRQFLLQDDVVVARR